MKIPETGLKIPTNAAEVKEATIRVGEKVFATIMEMIDNHTATLNVKGTKVPVQFSSTPQGAAAQQKLNMLATKADAAGIEFVILDDAADPQSVSTALAKKDAIIVTVLRNPPQGAAAQQQTGSGAAQSGSSPQQAGASPSGGSQQASQAQTTSSATTQQATRANPAQIAKELPADGIRAAGGKLDVVPGEIVEVAVTRVLSGNAYQVNIKGQPFTAILKSLPQFAHFQAEVLSTEPQLELKMIKTPLDSVNQSVIRGELGKATIEDIVKALKASGVHQLKAASADAIKDLIINSGQFFERKLLNGDSIANDAKFLAYKQGDDEALNAISRLQMANVLTHSLLTMFDVPYDDIKEGMIRIKKDSKGNANVHMKITFSKIGDTMINIRPVGAGYDILVMSEEDISKQLKSLTLDNTLIRWAPLDRSALSVFDVAEEARTRMGRFEVII